MIILLRSTLFNIIMFGSCFLLSVWGRIAPRRRQKEHALRTGQLWARITLRALKSCCNIRIELNGEEFVPRDGAALVAAQHQSAFDTLLWLTVLPRPAYVLKRELTRIPIYGPLLISSGFIAVDREAGAPAMRKMVTECRAAIADGRQIIIFPEGTRVGAGKRGAIQPGILGLARVLRLPVIPATTNSGQHWGKKAFLKYPGTIKVTLHDPIVEGARHRALLTELEDLYYGELVDNSGG